MPTIAPGLIRCCANWFTTWGGVAVLVFGVSGVFGVF
jgi:hypothetical protein